MVEQEPAFQAASPEAKAGFVAHLFLLAGDQVELSPALLPHLTRFAELADLQDDLDEATRQARVDAFFERWPIPGALLALLEAENEAIEVEVETATRRAFNALGLESSRTPTRRQPIPGTFGGGALGLIAVRTGHF